MSNAERGEEKLITLLRSKEYRLGETLGQGACGKTVLLYDDVIDEKFVCKKYVPWSEEDREQLFKNFVREIKLLHKLQHDNVVRVYNYYLYPDHFAGFILMEHIEGFDIGNYVRRNPESLDDLFVQALRGFAYLESQKVLHRDIRRLNILVRSDGVLKIIDLGFGKFVGSNQDFDKSVSLNWWCDTPAEFQDSRYDFATEVYFVGKLFEALVRENDISSFKYRDALAQMCAYDPKDRAASFRDVESAIANEEFLVTKFHDSELNVYRSFSESLCNVVASFETGIVYEKDIALIIRRLEEQFRACMLEVDVPTPSNVVRCFVDGVFRFYKNAKISVDVLREFLDLFRQSNPSRQRVILANIHTKLNAVERYAPSVMDDDDIPF